MSFQAGVFYFDERPVPECEASSLLGETVGGHVTSYTAAGVFLAHASLQLDDRNPDGPQPYIRDASAITFDGRLDNREDLLFRLRDALGPDISDAALAFAAYTRWGTDGLAHLIGDWSLAIWDA